MASGHPGARLTNATCTGINASNFTAQAARPLGFAYKALNNTEFSLFLRLYMQDSVFENKGIPYFSRYMQNVLFIII